MERLDSSLEEGALPYGDYSAHAKAGMVPRKSKIMVVEDIEKSNVIDSIREVSVYSTDNDKVNLRSGHDVTTPKNVIKHSMTGNNSAADTPYSSGNKKSSGEKKHHHTFTTGKRQSSMVQTPSAQEDFTRTMNATS